MERNQKIGRGIDKLSDSQYKKLWEGLKLEIEMIEKQGECKHNLGDKFVFESPYKRPENVCFALLHVLDLYTWRAALGYPSWNEKHRSVYRIHCPDAAGTIWELRRVAR